MAREYLDEEQQRQLEALVDEADAATPPPAEEEPAMEETEAPDEVDTVNENVEEIDEGDAEPAPPDETPDPAAAMEAAAPQAPAPQLPAGFESVEQLIGAYTEMAAREQQRGNDMATLRDLNAQLVSIAEALGYGQELGSVDLSVDESLMRSNPAEYTRQSVRKEIAEQLKPMLEQQQANLRGRMLDQAWRTFAAEHGDVSEMMDDIKEYLSEHKDLYDSEDGLGVAYHMARSKKYRPEKALMEDEDFLGRAAANPKVREKVIADYLKELARSGEGAPASVGGGGSAVPTDRKKQPTSMRDVHKLARKLFGE